MFKIIDISGIEEHAREIFLLEKECFPTEYWSYESVCKNIKGKNTVCIACFHDDSVIGYIIASRILDEAELERIAVCPSHRGKGIGKGLINELINILRKNDVIKLMLEVRSMNLNAIALYTQFGFTSDTVRKNYYINPSDDALLMSLVI